MPRDTNKPEHRRNWFCVERRVFDDDMFEGDEFSRRDTWLWLIANAEMGLHSNGRQLGFPFRQPDGTPTFTKWRGPEKSFRIEPSGQALLPWGLDRLNDALSSTLIITEGEIDALSVMTAGAGPVVSVPNGASSKPGEGDVVPAEDRGFAYLWDGNKLRADLAQFSHFILATDGDGPGQVLRGELAIRLGRKACAFVTYPEGTKDANDAKHETRASGQNWSLGARSPESWSCEEDLHRAVWSMVRTEARADVVIFHPANGGARSKAEAGRMKAQGVVPGLPDLIAIIPDGACGCKVAGLELKTERGRQCFAQRRMAECFKAAGANYQIARSIVGARQHLRRWGVID